MELAMHIAADYKRLGNMAQAVQLKPTFLAYTEVVGEFCQHYAGGEDFPLVKLLVAIEKLFNSSHLLGQEFLQAVTRVDFGSRESTFCMVRAMLVACNLSSPGEG